MQRLLFPILMRPIVRTQSALFITRRSGTRASLAESSRLPRLILVTLLRHNSTILAENPSILVPALDEADAVSRTMAFQRASFRVPRDTCTFQGHDSSRIHTVHSFADLRVSEKELMFLLRLRSSA